MLQQPDGVASVADDGATGGEDDVPPNDGQTDVGIQLMLQRMMMRVATGGVPILVYSTVGPHDQGSCGSLRLLDADVQLWDGGDSWHLIQPNGGQHMLQDDGDGVGLDGHEMWLLLHEDE